MSDVPTQRSRSSKPAQLPTVVSLFRCHLYARNQLRFVARKHFKKVQDMSSTHLCHFQPAPFSFDQRDHEMMVKKEEKIRKVDFVKLRMSNKFKVSK